VSGDLDFVDDVVRGIHEAIFAFAAEMMANQQNERRGARQSFTDGVAEIRTRLDGYDVHEDAPARIHAIGPSARWARAVRLPGLT
jgi:hypothetical protein